MDAATQALYDAAQKVRKHAHVPYSDFPVGAAILADDGNVYAAAMSKTPRTHKDLAPKRPQFQPWLAQAQKKGSSHFCYWQRR